MKSRKVKLLYEFIKKARGFFTLGMLSVVFETIFNFMGPLILALTVDVIIKGDELGVPDFMLNIVEAVGGRDVIYNNVWALAIVFVLVLALGAFFLFVKGLMMSKASEEVAKNIRNRVYDHMQKLTYDYHVKAETGDLIQRCTTDVETIRRFLAVQLPEVVRVSSMIIIALSVLLPINGTLTVLSLILMPIVVWISLFFFKKVQEQFAVVELRDGSLSTVLQEGLTGVRVVRAFGRQEYERNKFQEANKKLRDESLVLTKYFAYFYGGSDVLVVLQTLICMVVGIIYAVKGSITVGQYLVFITYVRMMIWPIRQFGRVLADMGKAIIATGRLDEILSEKQETSGENVISPPLNRDIEFKNVFFKYDEEPVLKDISFSVKQGETVAILGATGSGKSSLVQLLQRLYDCQDGLITIGDVDIKKIDKHHLRTRIGIVLQEPFLYSRTIKENIGIAEKDCDEKRIIDSAKTASVHEVIEEFENGYDTTVGERGVTLSGGQKQRVAIARTILRESDILIFDDSLSAVDTQTDSKIREALKKRKENVTTFIISHRISTLKEADKILVIGNGKIAQQGTHKELLEQEGLYKRIWNIQTSNDEGSEILSD